MATMNLIYTSGNYHQKTIDKLRMTARQNNKI